MGNALRITTKLKDDEQDPKGAEKNETIFLPLEIMVDILSRLPVKSLLRFRCVCKQWQFLIGDPHFIAEHLKKGSLEDQTLISHYINTSVEIPLYSFVGDEIKHRSFRIKFREEKTPLSRNSYGLTNSVNGLVVAYKSFRIDPCFYLLNPATRDFARMQSKRGFVVDSYNSFGLGFDDSTGDYKLVRLNTDNFSCEVLTLVTQVWRHVEVPHPSTHSVFLNGPSLRPAEGTVFLNGAIHWLVSCFKHPCVGVIMTFDIKDEKFQFISIPQTLSDGLTLMNLEGHICVIEATNYPVKKDEALIRIWMLHDYANHEWKVKYDIEFELMNHKNNYPHIIDIKDGKILMQSDDLIYSYDPQSKSINRLYQNELCDYLGFLNVTVGSLVSPRNLFKS